MSDKEMDNEQIKRIIEALLFVSSKPLYIDQIKETIEEVDPKVLRLLIVELKKEYDGDNKSFKICEIAGGFQLLTDPAYGVWVKKLLRKNKIAKLSSSSLETLAIIAYRQPITRSEIEFIRGVNVEGVLKNLFDRGLIKIAGHKQTVGRPILYGTTREFLEHFGLKSLNELPKLEELHEPSLNSEELFTESGLDRKPDSELSKLEEPHEPSIEPIIESKEVPMESELDEKSDNALPKLEESHEPSIEPKDSIAEIKSE